MANEDLVGDVTGDAEILPPLSSVTLSEELFIAHYVRLGRNGKQAAIAAGFAESGATAVAQRMLNRPRVRKRLAEVAAPALSKAKMSMDTMLGQLAAIATYDRRKLYHPDGTRKHFTELDDETAAAISHMGANDFVPHDKLKAIDMSLKHLGGYEKDNEQRRENLQIVVSFE